jgi:hypothetical protein
LTNNSQIEESKESENNSLTNNSQIDIHNSDLFRFAFLICKYIHLYFIIYHRDDYYIGISLYIINLLFFFYITFWKLNIFGFFDYSRYFIILIY